MKKIETIQFKDGKYAVLYQHESGECDPCPFCEKKHVHSKGSGHRVRHCDVSAPNIEGLSNGYYVIYIGKV